MRLTFEEARRLGLLAKEAEEKPDEMAAARIETERAKAAYWKAKAENEMARRNAQQRTRRGLPDEKQVTAWGFVIAALSFILGIVAVVAVILST